jgi:hypothetical protein
MAETQLERGRRGRPFASSSNNLQRVGIGNDSIEKSNGSAGSESINSRSVSLMVSFPKRQCFYVNLFPFSPFAPDVSVHFVREGTVEVGDRSFSHAFAHFSNCSFLWFSE